MGSLRILSAVCMASLFCAVVQANAQQKKTVVITLGDETAPQFYIFPVVVAERSFLATPPSSVVDNPPGAVNYRQQGFHERQNVPLTHALEVDNGHWIPSGYIVSSHMIFLNTDGSVGAKDFGAIWRFDDPIIGVMSKSNGRLEGASTDLLGHPDTEYPPTLDDGSVFLGRGLESKDSYELIDTHAIKVNMAVSEPGDWIRVITLVSSPEVPTVVSAGQVWMDRNLGASRVAQSYDDEEAYGDLYQWGRGTDGHEKRDSGTTSKLAISDTPGHGLFITPSDYPYGWRTPQNDDLWQGVSGANNPCPAGFRLPTSAELDAERATWASDNAAGAFASPLKLVVAGYRGCGRGTIGGAGSYGDYWSSTAGGSISRYLYFISGYAYMGSEHRAYGLSVRCLKD